MTSFKLAAIKILKESKEPLHYDEITKRALDQNLIETTGQTPEATMNAQIAVDIKVKKENSAFIRSKPGCYILNPNYSKLLEKEEKDDEKIKEIESSENISTQYIGKAGEFLVTSELLFRGYNASIMSVDEGIDIVAIKNERLYNIQVKTSNENKFYTYIFDIRITSFERFNNSNTFYILVLKGKEINYLILPYLEIKKNIDLKNILVINKDTRYRLNIKIRDNKLYLGNKENNCSYFLNNWDLIK